MRATRWSSAIVLGLVLPLLACEPAQEEMPAGDEEMAPAAEEPTMDMTEGDMMTESVAVTNAMPHPMVVYRMEDGERRELGTVEADATETFMVEGQADEMVELVAEDTAQTHTVEETATVGGEPTSWTLGGG